MALPKRIDVVSPTSVAAPSRLEPIAIAMIAGTGEIFNLREMVMAIGATMSTVATLSTNAEMTAANTDKAMMATFRLGDFSMILSARSAGIFDSMKMATSPMVPAIIMMTFQSMAENISLIGK